MPIIYTLFGGQMALHIIPKTPDQQCFSAYGSGNLHIFEGSENEIM